MAYDKKTWVDGDVITAEDMNNIENGIAANDDGIAELNADLAEKANIDGYYEGMTVGNAEQLLSSVYALDSEPYTFRTSGGSADIGNREYDEVVGGTVAWNQLVQNGDFVDVSVWNGNYSVSDNVATITANNSNVFFYQPINIPTGHKWLICADMKASVAVASAYSEGSTWKASNNITTEWQTFGAVVEKTTSSTSVNFVRISTAYTGTINIRNAQLFDLTQMFGSTIADYIYSLETANTGDGVAYFRKLFPNAYYPYNAGELKSVEGVSKHVTVGFNQWDEEWEVGAYSNADGSKVTASNRIRSKNYISIFPSTTYYGYYGGTGGLYAWFYDENNTFISVANITRTTFTTPSNARYMNIATYNAGSEIYNHDICINLSWSGYRNGEYEPYVKHSYPLDDSLTLRGVPKLDASNNLYYDGDTYGSDGMVTRKYATLTLNGTEDWKASSNANRYYVDFNSTTLPYKFSSDVKAHGFGDYAFYGAVSGSLYLPDKEFALWYASGSSSTLREVMVRDDSCADVSAFKAKLTTSPLYIIYELATPTTEEAEPYTNPQIVDDFGTEEYVTTSIVPVGHNTKYLANLRDKLQHLPDLAESDGYYMINQSNYAMSLELFRIPKAPTTDGTYTLKATVSGGTPTYTWVDDSEVIGE